MMKPQMIFSLVAIFLLPPLMQIFAQQGQRNDISSSTSDKIIITEIMVTGETDPGLFGPTLLDIEVHIYESGTNNFLGCSGTQSGLEYVDESDILYRMVAFFQTPQGGILTFDDIKDKVIYLMVIEDDQDPCPASAVIPPDDIVGKSDPFPGYELERPQILTFGRVRRLTISKQEASEPPDLPLVIRPSGSDLVGADGKIEIYVPPRAVERETGIIISACKDEEIFPYVDPQVTFANLCYKIEPTGLRLAKSATLTLTYPDSWMTDRIEQKLSLYHSPNGKSEWKPLGGSVNAIENKITTSFTQGGVFALYLDFTVGRKAGISKVSIGPRVFSPVGTKYSATTNISFELGKESVVTIKVFNTSGRLVWTLAEGQQMNRGTNVVSWNGRDDSGRYCVSGIYTVVIRAENQVESKTVVVMN